MLNEETDDPFAAVVAKPQTRVVDDEGDDPFASVTVAKAPAAAAKPVPLPEQGNNFMPTAPLTLGNIGGVTPSFIPRLGQAPVLNPFPAAPPPPPMAPTLPAGAAAPVVDESSLLGDWRAGVAQAKQAFNAAPLVTNIQGLGVQANEIARLEAERDAALAKGLNNTAAQLQAQIDKNQRLLTSRTEQIPTDLQDIADAQKVLDATPTNPTAKEFMKDENSWGDLWNLFKQDPYGVSRTLVVRSLPASAPSTVGTIAGGMMGGPLGAVAGSLAGGFSSEFGSAIMEAMGELGADPNNPEQFRAVFEANKDAILQEALIKAGIISVADAATGGFANKLGSMKMSALSNGWRKGTKVGGSIALDAAGGGGGEALAQMATKGEITSPASIAGEVIGSTVMGPLELIGSEKADVQTSEPPPPTEQQQQPGVGQLFGVEQKQDDPFLGVTATPDPFAAVSATGDVPGGTTAGVGTTPTDITGEGTTPPAITPAPEGETVPSSPAAAGQAVPPAAPVSPAQPAGTPPAASPLSAPQGATPTQEGKRGPSSGIWAPITKGESGGDYNIVNGGKRFDLTNMTIAQVQELQNKGWGGQSTAAGRWQMIKSTLTAAAKGLGLDPNTTKFDQQTQDRMAQWLLDEKVGLRKFRAGEISQAQFLKNLRNEWEALPKAGYSDAQLMAMVNENGIIGDGVAGVPNSDNGWTTSNGVGLRTDEITQNADGTLGVSAPAPNAAVSVPDTAFETQRQQFAAAPKVESPNLKENTVSTDAGQIKTRPMVVDMASLLSSDKPGYDPNLQPRDRSRVASQAQVNEIASQLDPNKLVLSPDADRGAPIVNDAGMVESGNGRVMALRQAYERRLPGAQAYRDHLQSLGFNTAGMQMPVLVQQRVTPLTPQQVQTYVHGANKPKALAMSATEQAAADAKGITPQMLSTMKDRTNPAANQDFVREFMKGLTTEERGALIGSDGRLNQAGVSRLRNAVFAAAYGDTEVLSRVAESTDDNVRGLSAAMMDAAPAMAKLGQNVTSGQTPAALDIRQDLVEAVNRLSEMRDKGLKLDAYLAQQDAFNPISPRVEELMRTFYNERTGRQRSKEAIGDFLRFYAEEASKVSAEQGLMGFEPLSRDDVTATAKRKAGIDAGGNQNELPLDGERGNVAPVQESNGDGANQSGSQEQGRGPDKARSSQSSQREDNGGGRGEDGGPDRQRKARNEAGPNTNERSERDRTPNRNEPEKVKGERERASETLRPSNYEDVWTDLGIDPVEAGLWPIERQFNAIAKGLKEKFGLANVEKTPKTISKYAVDQLKDAYRNLQFMAGILQISNQAIGLNKFFGLTLRKGSDEYLGAFYQNGREGMEGLKEGGRAIVVPGRANVFAHEWGHALDYKLSEIFRGADPDGNLKSLVEYVRMLDRVGSKKLDQEALTREERQKVALARALSEVVKAIYFQQDGVTLSDFALESTKFAQKNGEYWSRAREMFSRSFEAYVALNAERFGGTNEFLGLPDRLYSDVKDGFMEKVYPNAADKMRLFAAFDDLMTAVRTNTDLSGGAAMFPGNPTALPSSWRLGIGGSKTFQERFLDEFQWVRSLMRGVSHIAITARTLGWGETNYLVRRGFNYLFASMRGSMMSIQARRQSATFQKFIDMVTPVPGVNKATEKSYEEAREWKFKYFSNTLGKIVKAYGVHKYTPEEMSQLRELLVTAGRADALGGDIKAPIKMKQAAVLMRRLMDEMFYYGNVEGGLDIGYTKNGYLPRMLNEAVIMAGRDGFIRDAAKVYDIQFERNIAADADAVADFDLNGSKMDDWNEVVSDAAKAGAISYADHKLYRDTLAALRENPDNEEMQTQFADVVAEIFDRVKEHYSNSSAEHWYSAITEMSPDKMFRDAPPNRFTKKRTLPPEADMILERYYYNNPVDLIRRYASSITRKVEFAKRFGQSGERFYDSLEAMRKEGLDPDEIQTVVEYFQRITGTESNRPNWGMTAINSIYVASTMRLMLRSLFTNLFEPLVVSLRTGNIADAGRVVKGVAYELGYSVSTYFSGERQNDTQYIRDMAEFCGIVADTLTEQITQQHISDQMTVPEWLTAASSRFYENIGLAGFTRVSRRVAMKIGMIELERQSKKLLEGGDKSKPTLVFSEGGIPEAMHQDFARWYLQNFGNGYKADIADIEGQAMTPYLQTFLARWTDQTLQDPKRVDKPYYATGPLGRLPFGLMSFGYAFFNNVVKRAIRIAAGKGDLSGTERAKFIAASGGMAALYIMGQTMAGVARTELYGEDEDKKKKRLALGKLLSGQWDGDVADLVQEGISRSGFFGPLDPTMQFAYTLARGEKSVRYEATIPKLAFGPQIGSLVDDAIRIAGVTDSKKNVPGTDTAEFNMSRGLYNVGVGFMTAGVLGLTPLGPLGALALGNPLALPSLTTPKVRDNIIESVTGYDKPQKPGEKKKGKPQGIPGTGMPRM